VSLNPVRGEVYSIQHYVIKFVSDLRQVGGFLRVLQFSPPIKLTAMYDMTEILSNYKSSIFEEEVVLLRFQLFTQ
jgi:hypothetical protein